MPISSKTRAVVFALALLGVGGLVGTVASFAVLYDKPGNRAVDKLLRAVGVRKDVETLYAFGRERLRSEEDWARTKSPRHPQWAVRPGLDVELIASGFTNPVNIVFPESPGTKPDDVLLYVGELHGRVKLVTRSGQVAVLAQDLINFEPLPVYKTDERGITGLATIPGSPDLIVTGTYVDKVSGLLRNRVLRLVVQPDARSVSETRVLLDMEEFTAPSHQIQQALFGPDGKLYVSVGDGETPARSRDMTKWSGKLLRMNADGSACDDNPFYDPQNPSSPRSYVHALGLRNVFDFDFDAQGRLFAGDNGQNDDRLISIVRGGDYAWDGRLDATRVNALYTWGPVPKTVGPVGLEVLGRDTLGPGTTGKLYLGLCGDHHNGESHAKKIVEVAIDSKTGLLQGGPEPIVQYIGALQGTVIGVEEGPDGLYFTDIFGEVDDHSTDHVGTGNIWKVVVSEKTRKSSRLGNDVAKLDPIARGEVYFQRYCSGCHRVEGMGGRDGPELTHLLDELERLNTPAYEADLNALLSSTQTFMKEQAPRLHAVKNAKGFERKRVWVHHHIEEPRFDNAFARMPSFAAIPSTERDDIIRFLLERNNRPAGP